MGIAGGWGILTTEHTARITETTEPFATRYRHTNDRGGMPETIGGPQSLALCIANCWGSLADCFPPSVHPTIVLIWDTTRVTYLSILAAALAEVLNVHSVKVPSSGCFSVGRQRADVTALVRITHR
jgi:hypothetical protein